MSNSASVPSESSKGQKRFTGFVFRYGLALFNVGWASLARWQLEPIAHIGDHMPYATFFLAIMLTAWFAGVGPSILAMVLGFVVANWVLEAPEYEFTFTHPGDWVAAGTFLGVSVAFLALTQAARHAKTRAEANARTARLKQAELERLMAERQQAQEALRQSEERFRTMAAMVPAFINTRRADGFSDFFNQQFYEYTGLPPGAALGEGCLKAIHPEDKDRIQTLIGDSVRTGQAFEAQYRIQSARGEYRWFLGRMHPLRDAQGRIVQWFGVCVDIEEQKQAEDRLEQRVAERTARLRETIADLEHFSYTITHDMRAPLRAMRSFGEILLNDLCAQGQSSMAREYLQRITTAAERMDRLIQDALQFSQVARAEIALRPVEVAALLRGIIHTYPNLQPGQADIRLEGPLPLVLGNEAALTQCFSNLLGNAVKFVAPGTFPRVRVWAEPRGEHVRVWVEDNGIGIPRQSQELIFQMFQRINPEYEGTGIGLAIVRKAAERMGGKVGVESEVGQGSRFWLELQRAGEVSGGS